MAVLSVCCGDAVILLPGGAQRFWAGADAAMWRTGCFLDTKAIVNERI